MMVIDQKVRNTFNEDIVDLLRTNTGLFKEVDEKDWDKPNWIPSKLDHPINRWHTPNPFDRKEHSFASKFAKVLVAVLSTCEIILGFGIITFFKSILSFPSFN